MKKIDKGLEPAELSKWKARNPGKHYGQLESPQRAAIRHACAAEQFYLCAYCCQTISGESNDTTNEHLQPRDTHPHLGLDFSNIVASCTTDGQCDKAHAHQVIPLTPLMPECEHELRFMISGRVEGLSDRAKEMIRVLNLGDVEQNNRLLIEKRKQLSHALMRTDGLDPYSPLEDDELLESLIDELNTPINGKLQPFAPVVCNILRGWLTV
ncbi:TIGR02646 family protein [Pseudomonas asiatica]|uniref:retron system putative HNH endonuclease n=1 Tax=Pseudomonas asiatica TaxID=2219225 RepID=UPI0015F799B3|nr:retron system putative HNH endonuclease [Pseudomonas asiatica]MBA6110246.1 TIGR02646 family protein [Pseudomonas asiatica]